MLTIPHLRSQTTALPDLPNLRSLLTSPRKQLAWIRGDDGVVAAGSAAQETHVPQQDDGASSRFNHLTTWWNATELQAEIRDEVRAPGTGLFAFGSFSFSTHSPAASTLIIPQVLVGRRGGKAWLTIIGPDDRDVFETLTPEARALLDAVLKGSASTFAPFAVEAVTEIPDPLEWQAQVELVTNKIRAGEAEKVVLSRTLNIRTDSDIDERLLVDRLCAAYPSTWVFAVDGLIGASPEMLAASAAIIEDSEITSPQDPRVFARVLAGTLPNRTENIAGIGTSVSQHANSTSEHDEQSKILVASEKDQIEHQVAVESVVNTLSEVGTVTTSGTFVLALPNVLHLATDVVADLHNSRSIIDVAGLLHPTAALGGCPNNTALKLIEDIEATDRDRYGAPVGWVSSGNFGQWCVALRCTKIDADRQARAWAGGGIMADSIPSSELAETEAKFEPIMGAFDIPSLHESPTLRESVL
ncbi:menaquinone-specific isochorismate synthase [Arcanobacterium pluranimalium]|uniref:chorismate-binding protein n=1 Tax=Arcanobacterium pluranimalium TaxID=108028 RepID=UPI00195D248B|nr:menaquinone-specific isochorismate synthase [Arcanobacterium pluranimalium]